MLVLIQEEIKMIRQYKVLSGKWETMISVEREEWLFNAVVQQLILFKGNRTIKDLPLGVSIGIIEIWDTGKEIGDMSLGVVTPFFEAAGFYRK